MKQNEQPGTLAVERDMHVGGMLQCNGNAAFAGNVNIDGWLDARNLRTPCKGLFSTYDSLAATYPHPLPGWWALVGNTLPAAVYRVEACRWISTGEISSNITLPLDDLNVSLDAMARGVDLALERVGSLESALAEETAARTDADTDLDARLSPLERDHDFIEHHTVHHIEAPLDAAHNHANLILYNRHGAEIASCAIPVGTGGSGGTGTGGGGGTAATDATDINISAEVDHTVVKPGEVVTLSYTYDQVYISGSDAGMSTGGKAGVTLRLERGGTTVLERDFLNVARGTYTFNLTPYLSAGTTEIYLTVKAVDPVTGYTRTKQRYTTVFVSALSLVSLYDISSSVAAGGHATGYIEVPFTVAGSGTKRVQMWLDGVQCRHKDISSDTAVTDAFTIDIDTLDPGSHSVQLLATATFTDNEGRNVSLQSESVFFNFLKGDGTQPFVGVSLTDPAGGIVTTGSPRLTVRQYAPVDFDFVAYTPGRYSSDVTIDTAGRVTRLQVDRSIQHYTGRLTDNGTRQVSITADGAVASVVFEVIPVQLDIHTTLAGCTMQLLADGRSNNEAQRHVWSSGPYSTSFVDVDWASSGWTGRSLRLINGARAVIGNRLYADDVKTTGYTFEVEFFVENITDPTLPVISCIDAGKGLRITGSEIMFATGVTVDYNDEDGNPRRRDVKLSTNYTSGRDGADKRWIRAVHTVTREDTAPLMELYVNGNRVGADVYDPSFSFRQGTPGPIVIDSSGADVEVRSIRVYNRALSDDEVLGNSIAGTDDPDRMMELYADNAVTGENGIDMGMLMERGKGIIRIIHVNTDPTTGDGPLDDVFATNNKSRDFTADVYYYPSAQARREGAREFVAKNCYIRIQGTSSTKYPSKNIRIYLAKGTADRRLLIDGVEPDRAEYALRSTTPPQSVLCAKTDYSDSSMSLNTGGAKLFNEVFKEIGLLTPPQRHQSEQGAEVTVRAAIDGWPVDVFAAHSLEGANTYYGQYNLNNEKSKSASVFGMTGVDGMDAVCPLALETLNNSKAICLFQCSGSTAAEIEAWLGTPESPDSPVCNFDAACEVNFSSHGADGDVKWATMNTDERAAIVRLLKWVKDCVPDGATPADLSRWVSPRFVAEVHEYFDVDYLLSYYIWTDYFLAVDQRAKNILLRTWDGRVWYPTYYDGDTQMGKSNDSFLSYAYHTTRDTWDDRLGKYAFEGRDSWLWCLCLANLDDRLRSCAATLRNVLTRRRVLAMLNDEQGGNWSDRVYNKSGYLKYIRPALDTVYGQRWQFIFALQGRNRPHREYFVDNRFAVLDARYGCGGYRDDNIDLYLQQGGAGRPDRSVFTIIPTEAYVFGYSTNNPGIDNRILGDTGIVTPPSEAVVTVTGTYTANDPLRIYGASRIAMLDGTGASANFKNGLKLQKCTGLRILDLSVPSGAQPSTAWWIEIENCRQLQEVYLYGQSGVHTSSANSDALDFSQHNKLRYLDARGTGAHSIILAPGAPVDTLLAPDTVTSLDLAYLPRLALYDSDTGRGLRIGAYDSLAALRIVGCPLLAPSLKQIVTQWLDNTTRVPGACSLTLADIDWTLPDASLLMRIADGVGLIDISGHITITAPIPIEYHERLRAAFGNDCFNAEARLHIEPAGGSIIADDESNPEFMRQARASGWVSASATFMTDAQAAAVTDDDFYTRDNLWRGPFFNNSSITSLDELQYFTSLTGVPQAASSGNQKDYALYLAKLSNLANVKLPPHLTVMAPCFAQCERLVSLRLPDTLTRITAGNPGNAFGNVYVNAFSRCSALREVHFPASLQRIECPSMFMGDTRNLKRLYFYGATPPQIDCSFAFDSGRAFGKGADINASVPDGEYLIYVPVGSAAAYMANSWIATLVNTYNFTIVATL